VIKFTGLDIRSVGYGETPGAGMLTVVIVVLVLTVVVFPVADL
jgi:hypothetical protein